MRPGRTLDTSAAPSLKRGDQERHDEHGNEGKYKLRHLANFLGLVPQARPRPATGLGVWAATAQAAPCCEYATRQDNAAATSSSGTEGRISPHRANSQVLEALGG